VEENMNADPTQESEGSAKEPSKVQMFFKA
jgi:hypothetical protein